MKQVAVHKDHRTTDIKVGDEVLLSTKHLPATYKNIINNKYSPNSAQNSAAQLLLEHPQINTYLFCFQVKKENPKDFSKLIVYPYV